MVKYPMIEISEEGWDSKRYKDFYIVFDNKLGGFQFSNKDYEEDVWYRKLLFVDADGKMYIVKGLIKSEKFGLLKYIPFYKRFEFVFEQIDKSIQLESLKELLKKRAQEIKNEDLVIHIKKAATFRELLGDV